MAKTNRSKLVSKKVTYTLLTGEKLYIVENVPAQVDTQTGEQFFSPQTVEKLRRIVSEKSNPSRFIQAPVYEFR